MNNDKAWKQLKASTQLKEVPVITVTDNAIENDIRASFTSPLDIERLIDAVEKQITHRLEQ